MLCDKTGIETMFMDGPSPVKEETRQGISEVSKVVSVSIYPK